MSALVTTRAIWFAVAMSVFGVIAGVANGWPNYLAMQSFCLGYLLRQGMFVEIKILDARIAKHKQTAEAKP